MGQWTRQSPELELALGDVKRLNPIPLGTLCALDERYSHEQRATVVDRYEEAITAVVKEPFYQRALELHSKLEDRADAYRERARVREAVSRYLGDVVFPWAVRDSGYEPALEYVRLAQRLRDAREFGLWGVDQAIRDDVDPDDEEADVWWANRAGLVKLCPSDARAEGARVGRIYGQRLDVADELGYVLRYAVFSLPNFPQWHLRAGMEATYNAFRDRILFGRVDGTVASRIDDKRRRFPNLVGAVATLEAPLSGRFVDGDRFNAWNVHLNVILVFRPAADRPYGQPDYAELREAWGADVHFSTIPQGDGEATRAAIRELVKYPLQAVSEKSAADRPAKRDRFGNVLPPAPPLIEWPAECFHEWWQAHRGFRRTRSWGVLYNDRWVLPATGDVVVFPKPPRRTVEFVDWIGTVTVSPAACTFSRPRLDLVDIERRKRLAQQQHELRMVLEPEYARAHRARELERKARRENIRRRDAARSALFTLIQGNKFAGRRTATMNEASSAPRGPPF